MTDNFNFSVNLPTQLNRNDSFSTVSSSIANAEIIQQAKNLIYMKQQPKNEQNGQGIHVENVVYNVYNHLQKRNSIQSVYDQFSQFDFKENSSTSEKVSTKSNKLHKKKIIIIAAIVIASLMAIMVSVIIYFSLQKKPFSEESTTKPNLPSDFPYFIKRDEWNANPMKNSTIKFLSLPIKRIIIGQTGGVFCTDKDSCIARVKSLQTFDPTLDDIPYNFLIGGDGNVYEGRGIDIQGQHTENLDATEYNSIGICIAFIGSYVSISPNASQIEALQKFITNFIDLRLIDKNFKMFLRDDLKYFPSKATALNEVISNLDNFYPLYRIHRREEWMALRAESGVVKYSRIMNWTLIGHSVNPLCTSIESCYERARSIQEYCFEDRGFLDILYNIFFGGDGMAFEGRGFDNVASHHSGLNSISLGVGVIGTFDKNPPNDAILNAMLQVFDDAVVLGKLTEDFKIFGRSDFGGPGPGDAFMNKIKEFCRYGNRTSSCP